MTKKNLRKIPYIILKKLESIKSQYVTVGVLKTFKIDYILNGNLSHLNISIENNSLIFPDEIIPSSSQGKYSNRNINGYEITRRDLAKETHYRSMEV